MSFLKRAAERQGEQGLKRSAEDVQWADAHPALSEYLTADKYPDGGQRTTATLLVFREEGTWKGCLRDRDTARTLWASAGSLQELFGAIEDMLQSEDTPWRKDKPWDNKGGKKKQ